MESGRPLRVEAIYERILRRGSLTFLGYKRPFRAITCAMARLVTLGEACLVRSGRERSWYRPVSVAPSLNIRPVKGITDAKKTEGTDCTSEYLVNVRCYRYLWRVSPEEIFGKNTFRSTVTYSLRNLAGTERHPLR